MHTDKNIFPRKQPSPIKQAPVEETIEQRDARYPKWLKPMDLNQGVVKEVVDYKFSTSPQLLSPQPNLIVDALLAITCAKANINLRDVED